MKKWLIIVVAVISVLILASFRYISFSETDGKVIDSDGNPIANAKVTISYRCTKNMGFVDSDSHSFKADRAITDSNGGFSFASLNVGFRSRIVYISGCDKKIIAFKEGYCGRDIELCTRQITDEWEGFTEEQIKNWDTDEFYLFYRDGKYYESLYFDNSVTLSPKDKEASISLNKLELW